MKWVFLGLPGAGKGTQAKKLNTFGDFEHISTGDLLRAEVGSGSELGQKAKEFMDRGELVPDAVVIEMLVRAISGVESYVLDGFPRTLEQARALDRETNGQGVEQVFDFELSEDEVIRRLSGRRVCRSCGAMFHVEFMPTAVPGVCDVCGGSDLYQRDDDKPETIRNRTRIANEQAGPLLAYYREKGLLVTVDAARPADVVQEELRNRL